MRAAADRIALACVGELVALQWGGREVALPRPRPLLAGDESGELWIAYDESQLPVRWPRRRNLLGAELRYLVQHWGIRAKRARVVSVATDNLERVAVLRGVVYRTRKGGDGGVQLYEHKFRAPRPVLAMDPAGRLQITGGSARMTTLGIRG